MDPLSILFLIGGIVLQVGSSLLQQSMQPPPSPAAKPKPQGYRGKVKVGGNENLSFLLGTVASDGYLEYGREWGTANKTPNAYTVDVISFCDLPGATMTGLIVDGEEVTYQTSTGLVTQGYPVAEYLKNSKDHLWHEYSDGTQTTASSYLTGKFSGLSNRPWTTDFKGTGVCYAAFTARINEKLYSGLPEYRGIFQGIPLYDPREDTTAGGSGSQRWATPSTWTFSDNPAVMIYNILRGIHYDGDHVWGGNATAYQLPYATWAAAMDTCDESVSLKAGGTETRYRAGCEIETGENPLDVINRLLAACNGRMSEVAGQFEILIGQPASSTATLSDDDFIATEGMNLDPFPPIDDTPNTITATFMDPSSGWTIQNAPQRASATALAADGGQPNVQHMALDYVFSGRQVQRIMRAALNESRRFVGHVSVLRPKFGYLKPLDRITWNSTRNGYSSKYFLVALREILPNGNVAVALKEIDPSDHDWTPADDESDVTSVAVQVDRPAAQAIVAWSAVASSVADAGGSARRPSVLFGWDSDLDDVDAVRVQVRVDATQALVLDETLYDVDTGAANVTSAALSMLAGVAVEARGVYLNHSGSRDFTWSGWTDLTLLDLRTDKADLSDLLLEWRDYMGDSVAGMGDDLRETILQIAESSAADTLNMADIRQSVGATVETAKAKVTAEYSLAVATVASDLGGAVTRIEELEVDFEDLSTGATATASALSALATQVTANENAISSQAISITDLEAGVSNAATASALSALTARVTVNESGISAQATSITGVEASVGDITAGGLLKFSTSYTPASGWDIRGAFELRQTSGSSFKFTGFYFELKGGQGRAVLVGDEVYIADTAGTIRGMFNSDGATFNKALIDDLTATNIRVKSLDADEILVDGTLITAHMESNAVSRGSSGTASNKNVNETDSETTLISKNHTNEDGASVMVFFNCLANGTGATYGRYRLRRGSTTIAEKYYHVEPDPSMRDIIFQTPDEPGNGSKTYSVKVKFTGSNAGRWVDFSEISIFMRSFKR